MTKKKIPKEKMPAPKIMARIFFALNMLVLLFIFHHTFYQKK